MDAWPTLTKRLSQPIYETSRWARLSATIHKGLDAASDALSFGAIRRRRKPESPLVLAVGRISELIEKYRMSMEAIVGGDHIVDIYVVGEEVCVCGHDPADHIGGKGRCVELDFDNEPCSCVSYCDRADYEREWGE